MAELKKTSKFKQPIDVNTITTREKQLIEEICSNLSDNESLKIKQKFRIESIPEYDLSKSLFYQACQNNNIWSPNVGFIEESLGTKNAIRYPIIGISEDIRKLEKLTIYILEKYKNIKLKD